MLHIQDVTLSDGMHAIRGGYSLDEVGRIARALDTAGVSAIEVAPAAGLSGSSLTYGFGRHADRLWIEAAAAAIETARLGTLLIPGIGTIDYLEEARRRAFAPCGSPPIAPKPAWLPSTSARRETSV
jgi:4-hydroxy 2-oxovalerate aldolase